MKVRLGLFAASPVYYQAPLYRRVAADPRIDFTAVFSSDRGARRPFSNGFSEPVDWGVDPLGGYESLFLARAGRNPTGGSVTALRDLDVLGVVRRHRFDVLWLHGYHTVTHVLAAAAQKARGGAVLFREEQTLLTPRPPWKTAVKSVALRALLRGGYGLYIGSENRLWFERWGVRPERLVHVPYVVDNEGLRAAAASFVPERDGLRVAFGLPLDRPVILMLGRLVAKKQPVRVLEAFASVRRETPCSLLIAGTGPVEAELRRRVEGEGIPDVVFAGFLDQTQIGRAYAAADVFTLFSAHDETWGLVVNEAMNFGLPVVASDRVGCARDLVRHGETGFVVDHRSVDDLAAALRRLVGDSDLRERLGRRGRTLIEAWSYDRAAAGLLAAVEQAVGADRWSATARLPADRRLDAAVNGSPR